MCTVVLSLEPGERMPLLLLGVRDELTDRPWRPPARHWPGSPLIGGIDLQAGGTWLAVHPDIPRVACLLNGRGTMADPARRRSRGELPLQAAAEGPGVLKRLADDPEALAAYDPFHLICASPGEVTELTWLGAPPPGSAAAAGHPRPLAVRAIGPGTHLFSNAGHVYPPDPGHPEDPVDDPKADRFGARFAAARPSGDPALDLRTAWGGWLPLAAGDGLDQTDPRAIIVGKQLPDGRVYGSTSVTLVALAPDAVRYDFQPEPASVTGWYPVALSSLPDPSGGYGQITINVGKPPGVPRMPRSRSRKRGPARLPAAVAAVAATLAAAALSSSVGTAVAASPAVAASTTSAPPVVTVTPDVIRVPGAARQAPPTTAQCQSDDDGISCYQPSQLRTAYHLPALYAKGITGKGQTIAIVDSFGSPTIKSDLATFDKAFGIPAPPAFTIIHPAGKIPAFNPDNSDMVDWAGETTLDVEYAHAFAPGAKILLVETPVSETEGTTGFPQIVTAEKYVLAHYKVGVISQSFSATEETFANYAQLKPLRAAYIEADSDHVTVLAASGDSGATDYMTNMVDYYTRRVTSWPDSDPLVTAVGGTQLKPSASGYTSVAWNDTNDPAWESYSTGSPLSRVPAASGGGTSEFFARPSWQNGVKAITGAHRGVPDIAMSAACDGSVDVYSSFEPGDVGWSLTCGTSEATPEFAAIVALADQVAGHPLGLINPKLYALLAEHAPGLVDVTSGNNTVSFYQGSATLTTVTGYQARKGYDLVTGVGTINAALFVPELAG